jgi:hypothetical protein
MYPPIHKKSSIGKLNKLKLGLRIRNSFSQIQNQYFQTILDPDLDAQYATSLKWNK